MEKPRLFKKIKHGEKKKLNKKACRDWHDNHRRNPLTNRVIKVEGRVYNRLKKKCKELDKSSLDLMGLSFLIEKSFGDGNCFFHSVLKLVFPTNIPIGIHLEDDSPKSGHLLREFIAESFTFKDYVMLLGGTYAVQNLDIDYPYEPGDEILNASQLANKQEPTLKKMMKRKIKDNYKEFKERFSDWGENADEAMVEFTARKLRLNILVYNTAIPDRFVSARPIIKNRSSIFVYNWNEYHFDPLYGDDGTRVWKWKDVGSIIKDI